MTDDTPTTPPPCPRCREKGRVVREHVIAKDKDAPNGYSDVAVWTCSRCNRLICKA